MVISSFFRYQFILLVVIIECNIDVLDLYLFLSLLLNSHRHRPLSHFCDMTLKITWLKGIRHGYEQNPLGCSAKCYKENFHRAWSSHIQDPWSNNLNWLTIADLKKSPLSWCLDLLFIPRSVIQAWDLHTDHSSYL